MNTILVTGGTRRIGAAIVAKLRGMGFRVIVTTRGNASGDDVIGNCDFMRAGTVEELVAEVRKRTGGVLYGLVNNASVFSPLETLPADEAAAMMNVNHAVPVRLASELRPVSTVQMLDCRVLGGRDIRTPYEMSKSLLLDSIAELAKMMAPEGRVNGVAPGPVLVPDVPGTSEKGGAVLLDGRPTVGDVADAVAFLLTAGHITGAVLPVDSGQSLAADRSQWRK